MSETEPRSPAMLLQMAALLVGFSTDGGWPKSLTPLQLAALQYPEEGTLQEKKASSISQFAFLVLVRSAIEAGVIETVAIEPQAPARQDAPANRAPNEFASSEWLARDFVAAPALPVETSSNAVRGITPKACVTWFRATEEIPRSDYFRAWLGDEWQAKPPKVGIRKTVRAGNAADDSASKPRQRQDYFRAVWVELEKPKPNSVWIEVRKLVRSKQSGCPVVEVTGNIEFKFKYSDGSTEVLAKKVFQNDMSEIRGS